VTGFSLLGLGLGTSSANDQCLYEEARILFLKPRDCDVQGRAAEGVLSL